jgi:hypothetical protein
MVDDISDWTPAEREEFARLERTMAVDPLQEERTVRGLRAEGLLGAGSHDARWRPRPLRLALAIAAGIGCFLAGRYSERAGLWGARTSAATATGPGAAHAVLADSQQRSPVIRF